MLQTINTSILQLLEKNKCRLFGLYVCILALLTVIKILLFVACTTLSICNQTVESEINVA